MKTPKINSRILKLEVLKDTATRTSVNAVESRTTSLESDVATAQGDISTLQGNVATLTQGIVDAVSTHNTAPDSHADLRTAIARNADHAALSNVLPSAASQNHLTDDELEFFGTLPSTISDLMSNVEEVDADFVSISYNPSGGGGSATSDLLIRDADPVVWYKSDFGTESESGVPVTDGGAVMYWRDQSGNGYDLQQSTTGYRPTYRTGQLGGFPAIRLDGTDDHMIASTFPSIDLANCTIVFVVNVTSEAEYGRVLVVGSSGDGNDYDSAYRVAIETGTGEQTMRVSGGASTDIIAPLSVGRPAPAAVYTIRCYRRRVSISIDDVISAEAVSSSLAASHAGLLLGAPYFSAISFEYCLSGDIYEVAIFPAGLGAAQLGSIVTALRAKYGLV